MKYNGPMKIYKIAKSIALYRGESVYNKGGKYWTTDREWARQFTQSGQDKEVRKLSVPENWIYRADPLPEAVNEDQLGQTLAEAKRLGFKAIWVNEGLNEPNSVLML